MPGIPYLPSGQSELPAERYILFADDTNLIHRIDEGAVTKNGTSFTAHWESGTLNQLEEGFEFTLRGLELYYTSLGASQVTVKVSGDGGETFDAGQVLALPQTTGKVGRRWLTFDGLEEATGFDIRVRIELDSDILCNIFSIRPHIVTRGDLII